MDYQSAGSVLEDRYLKACQSVDRTIAPEDEMRSSWNLSEDVYMFGGRTALKVCHQAMAMAGKRELKRILDFPCGHGRALRYFRAAYPDADILVSDINEPGVEFCRTQFGAEPFRSYVELEKTELPPNMDLIWCGSLLTHLDERRSKL